MGNPGNQIKYNSPCLDVTKTNDGFKTTRGKEGLDFDKLMTCFPEDFKNLNLNDLDKALKEYMTRPEISQEARETINLILNEFIRKIGDYKKTLSLYRQEGRPFTRERTITIDISKKKEQAHKAEIDRLEQTHEEQLKKLIAHTEKLEILSQQYRAELYRLEQKHTTELEKQKRNFILELRKSKAKISQKHNATLQKLRQDYASMQEELKASKSLVEEQKKQIQDLSQKLLKLQEELNELKRQPSPPTPPHSPKKINISQNPQGNNIEWGFGNYFDGGARRTKKRRRRSNKTKLGRRLQNRISRRKTLRKRNKN
jgi:DNA repair exonuclease SbcCD ATPase subunit